MLTPILLFSFSLVLSSVYCSCPPDFELVSNGECRGYLEKQMLNDNTATDTAISRCKDKQMQPVIIHNSEHQSYWSRKTMYVTVLALTCNTNTKKWQWSDGSAVNFKAPQYDSILDKNCKTGMSWYLWNDGDWTTEESFHDYKQIGCTTQLYPPVPSENGCESFEDDKDDGVCYQISSTAVNFQEAKLICRSFGAIVASIHSSQANSFVRRLSVSKGKVNGLYLGAATSGKGNDFGWIDGSEWDYDNFYPGFPMNGLGDCVIMDTEGTTGQWVNVDCMTELSVACIRPQNYIIPSDCTSGPWVEGQIIYSPGFPFKASTPCDYIISVDAGKKVEVEILLLEANTCCDNLILFENYFGGNVIANLTGEISEKVYATTASNFMRVSWQPNGGVNVRGMMFTFRGID